MSLSPHLLVINRWDDEFARYHEYIDHARNRVTYITAAAARGAVVQGLAADMRVVEDLGSTAEVTTLAGDLAARHGRIERIIAMSEFDLDLAADLRARLGVPGPAPQATRLVRDKLAMKQRVNAAGIRVPRVSPALDPAAVHDFVREVGFPLIAKPRTGAASQGVQKIETPGALERALRALDPAQDELEEFVAGAIYHVDGLVAAGRLVASRPARYLNTCLDFALGLPLGSVGVDDPDVNRELERVTADVLAALELDTGVYHLEVIRAGEPRPGWVFLEIGGRVGGGEIPFVWRDVYGIDLVASWVRLQLDQAVEVPLRDEVAGFAMIPEPREVPCEVVERNSMLGLLPTLYAEVLPSKGDRLDGRGGYEHIGGRFRFRGWSSSAVERDVRIAMDAYRLHSVPCAG